MILVLQGQHEHEQGRIQEQPAPTINHFYEKAVAAERQNEYGDGKKMAIQRHQFMESYLKQFYEEWDGEK